MSEYPLVNSHIAMENHHLLWVNPLFQWPFSTAMLIYQRVVDLIYERLLPLPISKWLILDFQISLGKN